MARFPRKSSKDLVVWQRAMDAVRLAYPIANSLPKNEQFALADQIRRSAFSIPSNIAEGQKRLGSTELARYCRIALGSVAELETQATIAAEQYGVEAAALRTHSKSYTTSTTV